MLTRAVGLLVLLLEDLLRLSDFSAATATLEVAALRFVSRHMLLVWLRKEVWQIARRSLRLRLRPCVGRDILCILSIV